MQGSFLPFALSNASHCDRRRPLSPSRSRLCSTYPNGTHEEWLSTVWEAIQIVCWLFSCFLDEEEIQISLSLVFWATTSTYSVCHCSLNAWSGRICISHYTRIVGTKGLKFHNDVLKIKRFALLHFSNGKEHCMYSFKMFFANFSGYSHYY